MHLQNDEIPERLGPKALARIAISADKFDCVPILSFVKVAWFKHIKWTSEEDAARLMVATKLLAHNASFKKITGLLVLHYRKSFAKLRLVQDVSDWISGENIC